MRNKIFMATLMAMALIASACGGQSAPAAPTVPAAPTNPPAEPTEPPAAGTDTLAGTSWTLTTLNGQPALQDTTVTLNFVAGKAAGSDGCNTYNTSYTADATNIKFNQPIATTMMACPEPIMAQASSYLQALGQAATYNADGKQLSLVDASGKELATFAAQSSDLGGTSWIVTGYNNGKQAVVSVAPGTELTASFGTDGKLTGSAGCNSYTAAYETSGSTIKIGPAATTRKACEQAVMDQETQYLAALSTAAVYRIDGSKMELRTSDGALAATFQKAAASGGLPGTSWNVISYNNGKQAVVSVMLNTTITANFGADGRLSGNASCNEYSASYQTDGIKITIGQAISTQKFCASPEGVMDQETQYLTALGTAATYRIDGNKMEMRTADGALAASFEKAAGSSGLPGTSWDAISYNNGKQAVVSVMLNTAITGNFGEDGVLSGNASCNEYSASYQIDGGKIAIGPAVTTRKACEQAVMDQETQYLAALATAATYRITGDKLELRTADGALAASYQKAAAASMPSAGSLSSTGLQPSQIKLDTQGLPYAWQAVAVPATPYDASQPPGPVGLPDHIEILFGAATLAERQPGTPIMYLIPIDAYRQMWDSNGNPTVSSEIAMIYTRTVAIPSPVPTNGWPALPPEVVVGYNDLGVQVGRALTDDLSASKSGYRLVGRWMQSPNPVTNQGLRYVYQGFTNDGRYLVAFFYPVATTELPQTVDQVPTEDMAEFNADMTAAIQGVADELNTLTPADWDPDLNQLNALVGSLQIEGMKPAGLLDQTWTWVGTEAIGGALKPLADPRAYEVLFRADGTVEYKIDCNRGSGTFTYEGGMIGSLRTTLGPATLAECNDGGQGQQLVNGLMAAQNYKVRPGGTTFELVLPAGGGSLVFEAK
jgi:heat shock protein HslJ